MYWHVYILMYSHDRTDSHWAFCCHVESAEMLGIVERAMIAGGQTVKVDKQGRVGCEAPKQKGGES